MSQPAWLTVLGLQFAGVDHHPDDGAVLGAVADERQLDARPKMSGHGDRRSRDFRAATLLAGVAPSTRASGRHRVVTFRWASDTKLREAICDFTGDSWRGFTKGYSLV